MVGLRGGGLVEASGLTQGTAGAEMQDGMRGAGEDRRPARGSSRREGRTHATAEPMKQHGEDQMTASANGESARNCGDWAWVLLTTLSVGRRRAPFRRRQGLDRHPY